MENFATEVNDIMNGVKHLSYSALSQFLKSPRHFKAYKEDKEVTKAMEEGKRFHMACLEPEKFNETYWVLDDTDKCNELILGGAKSPRASKVYKEWRAEQDSLHIGKERLDKDEFDKYVRMNDALRSNRIAGKLMAGLTETEKFFKFQHDGFLFKGAIDGIGENENGKYLIDLKKVADASYKKIRWNIHDMNYDLQGGLYSESENCKEYYLIFVDSSCNITVVRLLPETLEKGFEKVEFAISKFEECAELDAWSDSYEFYNGGYINL